MESNILNFAEFSPDRGEDCFLEIANNPEKLRYWKEIDQLWRESLGVEVRRLRDRELFIS